MNKPNLLLGACIEAAAALEFDIPMETGNSELDQALQEIYDRLCDAIEAVTNTEDVYAIISSVRGGD